MIKDYIKSISELNSLEEAFKLLDSISQDKKNNILSLKESEILVKSIISKGQFGDQNNIHDILCEQLIANTNAYKLRIDSVDESDYNQGPDTSYFKVYRQSRGSIHDQCLRISIYSATYISTHSGNLIPLSKNEAEELDNTLMLPYKKPTNNDAEKHYTSMIFILNPWLKKYMEDNKINDFNKVKNVKYPTNWNAILYYFYYANKISNNINIEMKQPDYKKLPKEIKRK